MFSLSVTAQTTTITIPDPTFKAFLVTHYDTSHDGEIQVSEAQAVTGTMKIPGYSNITDLTGIEYFTGITGLDCSHEQLTSLDVSANTALKILRCNDNQLTNLDVSGNKASQYLACDGNKLTKLDVGTNTALQTLSCQHNQLIALDVSANTALQYLDCKNNKLTSLDVSTNTALQTLRCNDNQLTKLDVSGNKALRFLDCYSNQLTKLDVSGNKELQELGCFSNQLTKLNLSAGKNLLQSLYCSSNQLTKLDVSGNKALRMLRCSSNQLTKLDVSANTALYVLHCGRNQLTDIPDVTGCTGLYEYDCHGNYFNADDCPTIAAIEAMGLSTFIYNPQADGHTITCSAGSGGSIHPTGAQVVYDGSSQIVHISPSAHHHIADVLVDGRSVGAVTSYTFSNVTADHTIRVTFEPMTSDKKPGSVHSS